MVQSDLRPDHSPLAAGSGLKRHLFRHYFRCVYFVFSLFALLCVWFVLLLVDLQGGGGRKHRIGQLFDNYLTTI